MLRDSHVVSTEAAAEASECSCVIKRSLARLPFILVEMPRRKLDSCRAYYGCAVCTTGPASSAHCLRSCGASRPRSSPRFRLHRAFLPGDEGMRRPEPWLWSPRDSWREFVRDSLRDARSLKLDSTESVCDLTCSNTCHILRRRSARKVSL
ncbi:uncharacterized protein SCHCODRAFT_01263529 [Schizophyllum commune H4-8]|uniref:uncharacterized protein n=1 Tax=Schizophyllum commune (strain H4-8 / FGSC 9210) TaxID=578458 RepID=UPI0021609FFC|nr:uncharacterized protein SCHCODRAFT_01263529 [Schizophyllum commune H4-8]KAI5900859.1 hypothetical protein SCHCODRAFT_01263529 [Schizophyllum commune H4-8]